MPEHEELFYRTSPIRGQVPASLDDAERSVEIVVATEEPVEVFDFERFEIVREILLIDGAELPATKQVPLLDSHRRFDTANVLGSIRDLKPDGGQLVGRAHFSGVPEVSPIWMKVREGHLTDFSAGYKPIESQWVAEGETYDFNGRSFKGPVRVTKRWKLKEGSIVPIGADEFAKARARSATINTDTQPEKDKDMLTKEEIKTIRTEERERVAEITAMTKRFDLGDMAENLINKGVSVDTARQAVLDRIEARGNDTANFAHRGPITYAGP
ncbi:MAG: hypothetical protein GY850_10685, partial [bacterium]|nr:hypothetical protein [bacterium]